MPAPFDRTSILASFAAEVRQYLPRIEAGIRALGVQPTAIDAETLEECHRYAHTIKSASGMVGCTALAEVARPLEEALVAIGNGTLGITPAVIATFIRCIERLGELVNRLPQADIPAIVAENAADFATLAAPTSTAATGAPSEAGPFWPGWAAPEPTELATSEHNDVTTEPPAALEDGEFDAGGPSDQSSTPWLPVTVDDLLNWVPHPIDAFPDPPAPDLTSPTHEVDHALIADGSLTPGEAKAVVQSGMTLDCTGPTPIDAVDSHDLTSATPASADRAADAIADPALASPNDVETVSATSGLSDNDLSAARLDLAGQTRSAPPHHTEMPSSPESADEAGSNAPDEGGADHPIPTELLAALRASWEAELRKRLEAEIRERVEQEYRSALEEELWTNVQSIRSSQALVYSTESDASLPPAAEVLDAFAEEAAEHLHRIALALPRLNSQPPDVAAARAVRQAVHTLKGAAGMVGQLQVSQLAHQIEDLIDRMLATDAEGIPSAIDLIADACSALDSLIRADPATRFDPAALEALWQRLTQATGTHADRTVDHDLVTLEAITQPSTPDGQASQQTLRLPAARLDRVFELLARAAANRNALTARVARLSVLTDELALVSSRLSRAGRTFERFPAPTNQQAHDVVEAASDLAAAVSELTDAVADVQAATERQRQLTRQLQDDIFALRQVPFGQITARLTWAIRRLAATEGKRVELAVEGADVEIDRALLDALADPLLHLVRNAITHGIESREARRLTGKPEAGRITLGARVEGGHVIVRVADDGRGIDLAAVREAADRRGLLQPEQALTEHEILHLIFLPGLTTRREVSEAGGRGIGLDAVWTIVTQRGGTIAVESWPGQGTVFTIRLPQTGATMRSLIVATRGQFFAIPMHAVRYVARRFTTVGSTALAHSPDGGRRWVQLGRERVGIVDLGEILQLPAPSGETAADDVLPLVVAGTAEDRLALAVDQIVGEHEIVVKPLPWPGAPRSVAQGVATVDGLAPGARSEREQSRVVLVLDIAAIGQLRQATISPVQRTLKPARGRVLVVDDSLTVRRALQSLLAEDGWQVDTARDGAEALGRIADHRPDLAIVDVEMPHLDGFQLLAILRRQPATRSLPVIVLTSRGEPESRAQAARLGVDRYLLKPYHAADLLRATREVLATRE